MLDPRRVGNILLWRIDHEIFSTVTISLPLIQEGQSSVSSERMRTILVDHFINRCRQSSESFHISYRQ